MYQQQGIVVIYKRFCGWCVVAGVTSHVADAYFVKVALQWVLTISTEPVGTYYTTSRQVSVGVCVCGSCLSSIYIHLCRPVVLYHCY